MALTTLPKLKLHLGIAHAREDNKLAQILAGVEEAVIGHCGRRFESASYTEYLDGTGRPLLRLKNRPVTAITSVHVDAAGYYGHGSDSFGSTTEWVLGINYAPKSLAASEENAGLLLAITNSSFAGPASLWPLGAGNVKVVYTAGYATIPRDLELAVQLLCGVVRKSAEKGVGGPLASERFGQYAYSLLAGQGSGASGVPGAVVESRTLLGRYCEVAL